MITTITGTSSKADELALLKKIASRFAPGTYGADFLNARALDWFKRQMDGDMDTDLFAYIEKADRENRELIGRCAQLTKERDQAYEAMRAAADMAGRDLALAEERANDWCRAAAQWEGYYEQARDRADRAEGERDQARAELEQANNELIRLKAKLFDLMEVGQ
jgi:hypothetical protein